MGRFTESNAVPQSRVMVKAFWDHLEIMDRMGVVSYNASTKAENIDWAAHLEIFITKPRRRKGGLCKALPDVIEEYILTAADLKEDVSESSRWWRFSASIHLMLRLKRLGQRWNTAKQILAA